MALVYPQRNLYMIVSELEARPLYATASLFLLYLSTSRVWDPRRLALSPPLLQMLVPASPPARSVGRRFMLSPPLLQMPVQ